MEENIVVATDGSCRPNPGPGGWAAVLVYGDEIITLAGREEHTTNNRMEILAVVEALRYLEIIGASFVSGVKVIVSTDSQYVENGIEFWIEKWKRNGWLTAGKKPVKNKDLWQRLDAVVGCHDVEWQWVRGHTGHPYNEMADEAARREMKRRKKVSDDVGNMKQHLVELIRVFAADLCSIPAENWGPWLVYLVQRVAEVGETRVASSPRDLAKAFAALQIALSCYTTTGKWS